MSSLEEVLSEYQNNPEFKLRFKKNPEQALSEVGLSLNSSDLEKAKKQFKMMDEELDKRINK